MRHELRGDRDSPGGGEIPAKVTQVTCPTPGVARREASNSAGLRHESDRIGTRGKLKCSSPCTQ